MNLHKNKKNILFAGHDFKFLSYLIHYYQNHPDYHVMIDKWKGHNQHNEMISKKYLNRADIIFCEWGLGNAVWYSYRKKPLQKCYVRLHGQELRTTYYENFKLENIDQFITISPFIKDEFNKKCGIPKDKMTLIYNAVDCKNLDKTKSEEACKTIGMIGMVPSLKRIDRAIEIFKELWNEDNEYCLKIRGKMPDEYGWVWKNESEREYFQNIFNQINQAPYKERIMFDGYGKIDEWLKDIGFVLSVSDFESFHLAPAEGMASGAIPIVLKRPGANTIFPKEYIFNTIDEATKFIIKNSPYEHCQKVKDFVKRRYSKDLIIASIHQLIDGELK